MTSRRIFVACTEHTMYDTISIRVINRCRCVTSIIALLYLYTSYKLTHAIIVLLFIFLQGYSRTTSEMQPQRGRTPDPMQYRGRFQSTDSASAYGGGGRLYRSRSVDPYGGSALGADDGIPVIRSKPKPRAYIPSTDRSDAMSVMSGASNVTSHYLVPSNFPKVYAARTTLPSSGAGRGYMHGSFQNLGPRSYMGGSSSDVRGRMYSRGSRSNIDEIDIRM